MSEIPQQESRAWSRFEHVIKGFTGGQKMNRQFATGRKSPAQQAAEAKPSFMKKVKFWFMAGLFATTLIGGAWAIKATGFQIGKEINFQFAHRSNVEQSICDMVKPEHLTDYGVEVCEREEDSGISIGDLKFW
ncbi:MAG: hypothetical protein Alpg2KO_27160 [Alphaproteobacteria bacterium]